MHGRVGKRVVVGLAVAGSCDMLFCAQLYENQFADRDPNDVWRDVLMKHGVKEAFNKPKLRLQTTSAGIPDAIDWRQQGVVRGGGPLLHTSCVALPAGVNAAVHS
jgi:hypothetical protein